MYLIDTNILSELAKKNPNLGAVDFFSARETIIVSAVTLHEISYGIERATPVAGKNLQVWFEHFLQEGPEIINIDDLVSRKSGALRARSEKKGRS